jgi:AraC family transcriptional regulator of adaptative response / methylphosphotriester-DNA alkyltransferase methyltransferase
MATLPDGEVSRGAEMLARFKQVLDGHLDDFLAGRVEKMYELQEIAAILCVHPVHLSKVIRLESGQHACYFYQQSTQRSSPWPG